MKRGADYFKTITFQ